MSGATNYIQVYDADGVVGELGQGSNNQLLHLESPIGSDITIAQFKADKTDGTSIHFTVDAYGYQYARFLANNANDYRNTNNIPVLQINNAGKGLGLKIINSSSSTLEALNIDQDAVTSTHFRKIIKEDNTACCIWVSDGTTPHGALTGQAGDICLNGDSGNIYRCTGTTNWTAM